MKMSKLETKKIVIWGYGKQQKDFQYVFDSLEIEYYVTTQQIEGTCAPERILEEVASRLMVIVCEADTSAATAFLEKNHFAYKKNYCYAEDLFDTLDFNWESLSKGRKLAIWGTGDTCDYYESHSAILSKITRYIDTDINKIGCVRNGIEILDPSNIQDWKDWFIIVADQNGYEDIYRKLKSYGLQEDIDFGSYEKDYLSWNWRKEAGNREIVVWGTGVSSESWENISDIGDNITFYIDSNINKKGTFRRGKRIYHPTEITSWDNYYVIVAVEKDKYIREIFDYLDSVGLKEKKDYNCFLQENYQKILLPSEMMKKTYVDVPRMDKLCSFPLTTIFIEQGGYIYPDCPVWHNYKAFGRIGGDSCESIWNSNVAKVFRLSVINGTYSFCDLSMCHRPAMEKEDFTPGKLYPKVEVKPVPDIRMNYDISCNLKCRQCRKEYQTALYDQDQAVIPTLIRRVEESGWLNQTDMIEFSGNGEVFFGDNYKKLLFDKNEIQRKNVQIVTNGVLFNQENWDKIKDLYETITVLVSLDAATEETYGIVRGNLWGALMKNMTMLSELRKQNKIKYLELSFCVQMDNVKEMGDFVRLARNFHADRASFQKMYKRIYMSDEEYNQWSCFEVDGKPKQELIDAMKDPILKDPIVNGSGWLFRYM